MAIAWHARFSLLNNMLYTLNLICSRFLVLLHPLICRLWVLHLRGIRVFDHLWLAYVPYVMFSDWRFLGLCCASVGPFICGGHFDVPACLVTLGLLLVLPLAGKEPTHLTGLKLPLWVVWAHGSEPLQSRGSTLLRLPLLLSAHTGSGSCNSEVSVCCCFSHG